MNQQQMMILESFAGASNEKEVEELMDVLRDFYAKKLEAKCRGYGMMARLIRLRLTICAVSICVHRINNSH